MVAEKIGVDKTETEHNHNLTISTKLSTDQLICKSPQTSSPDGSLKSLQNVIHAKEEKKRNQTPITLYFGVLQILFGLLMAVLGVMVLVHNASLSQIGGGLWGGCLATLTGVLGVLSAAKDCCPLKTSPQRIALTAFLALSLVTLAVTNLVLVLAAIGLARDASKTEEFEENSSQVETSTVGNLLLPSNYSALLTGAGLVLVSACECIAAALSAYHSARVLCPCFKSPGEKRNDCHECGASRSGAESTLYAPATGKDVLVSNWLGKQQSPAPPSGVQPVYVVTTNSRKRVTPVTVAPVFPLATPPPSLISPPVVGYPLIPAPLGTTPPPLVHTHHRHPPEKVHKKRRRYPSDRQLQQHVLPPRDKARKQKKSREKQKTVTTEEVARTYTGLDRVIAEEFIEICDSARTTSSSNSSRGTNSETSNEYVGEKL